MKLQSIGRYEILNELGRGAMGIVYKGHDTIIDRAVAIKTIKLQGGASKKNGSSVVDRFYQEARIAGKLAHPNIATVYDVGKQDGVNYLVMEYVEGVPLESIIEKKISISMLDKIRILILTANALHYAHQHGVIHRDIKPANVMLLDNLQIKIMDFGIAKLSSKESLSLTQDGTVLGTPYYMAPEQLAGNDPDRQSDLFSLGVLAYELITGKKPFMADNLTALVGQINNHSPVPPSQVNQQIPENVSNVVLMTLEKKKENRYTSAGELADELEIIISKLEMRQTQDISEAKGYDKNNLINSLKKNYAFFSDFTDEEIHSIFKISSKEVYNKDDVIFEEGTIGTKMYIIISGKIKITKKFQKDTDTLLNKLKTGDCFGEMSIINSSPRFASAVASSDCILIAINEVILRHSEPKLCLKLYKNLSSIIVEKLKKSDTSLNNLMEKLIEIKQICDK